MKAKIIQKWRNLADTPLNQMIKVNINNKEKYEFHVLNFKYDALRRAQHCFYSVLAKNA